MTPYLRPDPMLLDIHSHHPAPYPQGVVSIVPEADFSPSHGQKYSIGLHPWQTEENASETIIERILSMSVLPDVVAIGECGIDTRKGAPLFRQMNLFKQQVEISETVGKPVIIHCVKAQQVIIGCHKSLSATQPWVIHGFRGKPSVAEMFLRAGLWLSFGEKFNPDTLRAMPRHRILAETYTSSLPVSAPHGQPSILALHAATLGLPLTDYRTLIADNTARFLRR